MQMMVFERTSGMQTKTVTTHDISVTSDFVVQQDNDSKFSIKDDIDYVRKFINNTDITLEELQAHLQDRYSITLLIIEKTLPSEYEKFQTALAIRQSGKYKEQQIIKSYVQQIAQYIKDGIEKDGIPEIFDLVDLYLLTQNYADRVISKIRYASELSIPNMEKKLLANFRKRYGELKTERFAELSSDTIRELIDRIDIVDCKVDSEGNYIEGSGRVIPKDVKESWLLYLREKNIPINILTYGDMFNRYKNTIERRYYRSTRIV